MALYLKTYEDENLISTQLIESERLEIGRAEGAEVHFNSPEISRNHARLILKPNALNDDTLNENLADLIDAGSRYGVWINDEQVWYHALNIEERFRISEHLSLCLTRDSAETSDSAQTSDSAETSDSIQDNNLLTDLNMNVAEDINDIELNIEPKVVVIASEPEIAIEDPVNIQANMLSDSVLEPESRAELEIDNKSESNAEPEIDNKSESNAESELTLNSETQKHIYQPALWGIYQDRITAIDKQIQQVMNELPMGINAHTHLGHSRQDLQSLLNLLSPELIEFDHALTQAREAVAVFAPADFALHINNQCGDLRVSQSFIEAFKIVFFALVKADEVDWLHIDFYYENNQLSITSDPPLAQYLDQQFWTHQMAASILGLN